MKIAGMTYIPLETVLPQVADRLTLIYCCLAGIKDKQAMFSDILIKKREKKSVGFDSPEAFKSAWDKIARGGE